MSTNVKFEKRVPVGSQRHRIERLHRTDYNFNRINFFELYDQSVSFRRLINSGKYIYIDGRIILCDKRIIQISDGQFSLSHTSTIDLKQYCVSFSLINGSSPSFAGKRRYARFCSKPARKTRPRPKAKHAEKEVDFESLTMNDIINLSGGEFGPRSTFQEEFDYQMEQHGITNEKLSELTGISVRTISRMRSTKGYKPRLSYIVASCVAMHLNTAVSRRLISLAGEKLDKPNPTERERFFIAFINVFYMKDVISCNQLMLRHNQRPLTKLI